MISWLINTVETMSPKAGAAILIFFVSWAAGFILNKIINRLKSKRSINRGIVTILGQSVQVIFITIGIISALGTMGVNVSAVVAGLGLGGFAMGFALKDILANMLAGVMLLLYNPFSENDHISVAGFDGTVISIDMRYTMIESNDRKILIPNSILFSNAVSVKKTN